MEMALIQKTGLFRLKNKYHNAARASWKAAREELAHAFGGQGGITAVRIAFIKARAEFAQYLRSHNGHFTLKPLIPTMLRSDQIAKYERELLAALDTDKQPNTRNIAISGPLSAGKRSFLHSFTERNPQYKYANISLAMFSGNNTQNEKMADVEQNIVQQLIYNISGKRLETDTPEQAQANRWKTYSGVLAAFLTSSSIATLSYVSGNLGIDQSTTVKALRLYLPDHLTASIKKYAPLLAEFSLFFIATILVLFLFKGLQTLCNGWMVRANRQEVSEDSSISNSYLNQITHAFAQSRYNVVIIEDLMNGNQLEALLEVLYRINRHLNNFRRSKQPIYFIYVLEDETLTARDRTRFFDLIIPIVPVINTINAGSKLYEQLETIQTDGQRATDFLDKELIYKVADYIDDMKVITNIVNEFDIYLSKFANNFANNIEALNKNKLFAMMVIKNLYPKEHAELTNNNGILWKVFNEFERKKREIIEEIRKDIEQTKAHVKLLERTRNKLPDSELSEALAEGTISDSFLNALTEEQFGPVLYLLRKGYLAEDYKDYLSCLYPGSISRNDKRLSLRLGEGQSFAFTQIVDSPRALLNHLTPSDLSEGRGLINAVVSQLLESPEANYNGYSAQSFLYKLFDLTENRFERLQDFIGQYIHSEYNNHRKLFTAMFTIDQALIIRCITDDSSDKIPKAELVAEILPVLISKNHSDVNTTIIPAINKLDDIHPIINLANEQPKVRQWLKNYPVKFDRLSLKYCSQEIASRVIEYSMYQLNTHMMGVLLACTAEERPTAPAKVSYSAICASENPALISQIHDQLEVFVKTILLSQPQLEEKQLYLMDLLNNPRLEVADRMNLISLSGQTVSSIKDITDTAMQVRLFKENRIEVSWSNIQWAFEMNGKNTIDPPLMKFISTPGNTEQLSRQALPYDHHLDGLLTALLCNEEITETTLEKLLSAFPATLIEQLEPENISLARMNMIRPAAQLPVFSGDS